MAQSHNAPTVEPLTTNDAPSIKADGAYRDLLDAALGDMADSDLGDTRPSDARTLQNRSSTVYQIETLPEAEAVAEAATFVYNGGPVGRARDDTLTAAQRAAVVRVGMTAVWVALRLRAAADGIKDRTENDAPANRNPDYYDTADDARDDDDESPTVPECDECGSLALATANGEPRYCLGCEAVRGPNGEVPMTDGGVEAAPKPPAVEQATEYENNGHLSHAFGRRDMARQVRALLRSKSGVGVRWVKPVGATVEVGLDGYLHLVPSEEDEYGVRIVGVSSRRCTVVKFKTTSAGYGSVTKGSDL